METVTVIGTLTKVVRARNTPSGNPRWAINVDGRVYSVEDDSQAAYNVDPSHVGKVVQIEVDRLGRFRQYQVVKESMDEQG